MNLPQNIKSVGFTLVELMVVVSIISILAASGAVVYSGINKNNRDATRQRDLNNVKQALELYFHTNNSYPGPDGKYTSNVTPTWVPNLIPTYFDSLPVDPTNDSTYRYVYQTSSIQIGTDSSASCPTTAPTVDQYYILYTTMENDIGTSTNPLYPCTYGSIARIDPTSKTYFLLSQ